MHDYALKKRPFVPHSYHVDEQLEQFCQLPSASKPDETFSGLRVSHSTNLARAKLSRNDKLGNPKFALATEPHMFRYSSMIDFHPVEDSPLRCGRAALSKIRVAESGSNLVLFFRQLTKQRK